ncbi:SDR family NAD(P)-dependent oxidoreductase [Suttonella sp. R2A3]|uniref:SDR family NAD(P)-dependent oxidoreductase n=1 Tax=Suttonella sp. R2A3 TaxID=2908648 RepID=UPI001F221624|nr:SDR family NAD(P)-dependent oxidoreductase [Suttonella sp. R2A3]UJF25387.1 SDR family NAD(P)-dependent oxidoreductase [Suttonella sp. R2A3]
MKDTLVIITGHSRGLGAALAHTWLERGAAVCGIARHGNPELHGKYGEKLREVTLNLADEQALIAWLASAEWEELCASYRTIWLFNNAGTVQPSCILGEQDTQQIALAVALNVTAPLLLANAVAARQAKGNSTRIVHISSGAANKAYPGWSVYGASKAALDQHARNASIERSGAKVVSIAPGVVDTAMQAELRESEDFPIRHRFVDLYTDKELQSADETAQQIVDYALSHAFAKQAVIDIRALS